MSVPDVNKCGVFPHHLSSAVTTLSQTVAMHHVDMMEDVLCHKILIDNVRCTVFKMQLFLLSCSEGMNNDCNVLSVFYVWFG